MCSYQRIPHCDSFHVCASAKHPFTRVCFRKTLQVSAPAKHHPTQPSFQRKVSTSEVRKERKPRWSSPRKQAGGGVFLQTRLLIRLVVLIYLYSIFNVYIMGAIWFCVCTCVYVCVKSILVLCFWTSTLPLSLFLTLKVLNSQHLGDRGERIVNLRPAGLQT